MIKVVGCGFVGSIFATEFAKLAFAGDMPREFLFIDGDTWERRNAANQNVGLLEATEQKPKAQTIADMVRGYEKEAEWEHARVTEDNISMLLHGARVIVDAVDNNKTRQLLYGYGLGQQVPVLHLGISEMGTGTVDWSHPEHDTFALSPAKQAGKPPIKDPKTSHLPPCELASMRSVGWNTSYCAAMALALYLGFDAWGWIQGDPRGWMTEWQANRQGYQPVQETWSHVQSG